MNRSDQRPLMQWMGRMLVRFVGLIFVIYGLLLFVGNTVELARGQVGDVPVWAIAWILVSGLAAVAGGILFILSFDGPARWRTRFRRGTGIALMVASSLIPSTVGSIVFVFAIFALPSLWVRPSSSGS